MSFTPTVNPVTLPAATVAADGPVAPPSGAASSTPVATAASFPAATITAEGAVAPPSGAVALGNDPVITSAEVTTAEEVPWHQHTCTDAVVDASLDGIRAANASASSAMRAVLTTAGNIWEPGTVITCSFKSGNSVQHIKVIQVVQEWEQYANIHFEFVTTGNPLVRIDFIASQGSWSFVGQDIKTIAADKATMNLGWIGDQSSLVTNKERGVILHEFGHTLGLLHEHQHPKREGTIKLKEKAVIELYTRTQGWSKEEVRRQILDVYNSREVSNYSKIDTKSIMMYFMPPEMNEQGIEIKPNNELSSLDKAFMIINYPFPPSHKSRDSNWSFEHALDVAGVNDDHKIKILEQYRASNWKELRYLFTFFCTMTRATQLRGLDNPDDTEAWGDWCLTEFDSSSGIERRPASSRGLATGHANLWLPGDRITYTFLQEENEATPYRKKRVQETFTYYSNVANLTFNEVPASDPTASAADIRVFFGEIPNKSSITGWSKIGTNSKNYRQNADLIQDRGGNAQSSLVLSHAVPQMAPTAKDKKGLEERTLFHEIGHALGLLHKHTPAEDTATSDLSVASAFDKYSVMLYGSLKGKKDESIPFNSKPSALDKAFLGALYPAPGNHIADTFEEDLRVLGLSSSFKELSEKRNDAFRYQGLPEFSLKIENLRSLINDQLQALAKAKSIVPSPARAPSSSAGTASAMKAILEQLTAVFAPTTGQMFTLQFPGRFLQKDLYAWDTSAAGIYGQFSKPTVVNESEFRLVDQLYNVGQSVGAPNGTNLSIIYEQCLNNLIPGHDNSNIEMSRQQSQIRRWLMKDVEASGWVKKLITSQHNPCDDNDEDSDDESGPSRGVEPTPHFAISDKLSADDKLSRMELAEALMQEYLNAKGVWEQERDDMINRAKGKDLEALTRKLARITPIREAQLAAKHADAVVRGYSHNIRQYLGYMDIKSPAEILQDAKDALREAASSSMDGAMKIYPVQLSPIDWFQGLSTSFTMEDLTSDTELIHQQVDTKSKQLDLLQSRLAVLKASPTIDLAALQVQIDIAQKAKDEATLALSTKYTSNVIAIATSCVDKLGKFDESLFNKAAKNAKIAKELFEGIGHAIKEQTEAQSKFNAASRPLERLKASKAAAIAGDTTLEINQLTVQINSLEREIEELTGRARALRFKDKAANDADKDKTPGEIPAAPNDKEALRSIRDFPPVPPESMSSGGSRWQDIQIHHETSSMFSQSSERSGAETSEEKVSFFFGGSTKHIESAFSEQQKREGQSSFSLDIAFRATMVTVDRGGWFQPQFFKQSSGYYHIDEKVYWAKWPQNIQSMNGWRNADDAAFETLNRSLFPAFPMGFIVCKDITIKVSMSQAEIDSYAKTFEEASQSASGVLFWSTQKSSHSQSSSQGCSTQRCSDGLIIRIPGPQILGYMLQFNDPDKSTKLPSTLPPGFLVSDDDYEAGQRKPATSGLARALQEPASAEPADTQPASTETKEKTKEEKGERRKSRQQQHASFLPMPKV